MERKARPSDRTGAAEDDRRSTASAEGEACRRIDAMQLFGDAREVIIVHEGQDYRLRRTSRGKLILTK